MQAVVVDRFSAREDHEMGTGCAVEENCGKEEEAGKPASG